MTRRKTAADLRGEAKQIRENVALMLVHAERLEHEADMIDEANAELARWWFEYVRSVRRAS